VKVSKILSGLALGIFLAALDQTVITTASLTISQYFHHLADQSWLLTSYIAASLLTTPIYGRLSDSLGRRRLFSLGLILFGLGSVLGIIASNFDLAILARVVQGLGAGGLFSLAFAVIADVVPVRDRGKYILLFVIVFGTASILGPILGGVMATQKTILGIDGWRWIFIFNLPFVAIALIRAKYLPSHIRERVGRFDGLGTLFFGTSILSTLALAGSSRGNFSAAGKSAYAIILVFSLIAFGYIQRKRGSTALFPPAFFKNRTYLLTVLTSAVASGAVLIAMSIGALSIQVVSHRSPSIAGVVLVVMGVGNLLGSAYASRIFSKGKPFKFLSFFGLLFLSFGFMPLIFSTRITAISLALFLLGIGSGLINQFTSVVAPAALGGDNRGAASAINTLFRQLGGLLGVSSALAVLFALWKVQTHFSILTLSQIQRTDFVKGAQPVYILSLIVILGMAALSSRMQEIEILTDN
jgi:MFS family permease